MTAAVEFILKQISAVWRFRWFAMLMACLVCLIAWLVMSALPPSYSAWARIDTRTRPSRVIDSMATQPHEAVAGEKVRRLHLALSEIAVEIQDTQVHLAELLLRYDDKHPDVIATRNKLEQLKGLEERLQAEVAALFPIEDAPRPWLLNAEDAALSGCLVGRYPALELSGYEGDGAVLSAFNYFLQAASCTGISDRSIHRPSR